MSLPVTALLALLLGLGCATAPLKASLHDPGIDATRGRAHHERQRHCATPVDVDGHDRRPRSCTNSAATGRGG